METTFMRAEASSPSAAAGGAGGMFDFSHVKRDTQQHLTRVYGALTAAAGAAAVGAYSYDVVLDGMFSGFWLLFLGSLFCVYQLKSSHCNDINQPTSRWLYLLGFGFLTGVSIGPLLDLVAFIDPSIPTTALVMTTLVFATFTMMALQAPSRTWLYLGGILGSMMLVSLTMAIVNIFLGSIILFQAELMLGMLIFSGFVVFDTQVIITKHELGDRDYLSHALDLFVDAAALFKRILVLLAQNKARRSDESGSRRNTKRR
ncbi:hypothetical protein PTSG_00935 [Salpingoeca rosetta]|uniref:Bax inhibitor 1 n=1 Tax=Salpingoeca rosetta (strain ATCC 50818 / BSB-021) TaxID=946362 RepID=F2TXX4_SALR5|nr:uncharacterized protein PTSG_00935 [Salpingoeca rosetta]EGD76233.1 hypothetical protein PTSG_00935 [Salpingoeca rosetta]|eukprot:XP_004998408.1 hypothetical protein PTSG_00935 [Salpingoeca rosetta]